MSSLLTGIAAAAGRCHQKERRQQRTVLAEKPEIFSTAMSVFRCHMCYKLGRCFRSGSPFKISFAIQRRAKLCSCREAAAAQRPPARCVSFLTTPLLYGTSLLETQNSK